MTALSIDASRLKPLRTARKIADGRVYVPSNVWNGGHDA